jgi:predicted nuclease with RNAse H fold
MGSGDRFVGIDLGARSLHVVTLAGAGARLTVHDARVVDPDALAELTPIAASARAVAIDAPAAPSRACHARDTELAPKFRTARCGEIALGRATGIWVPWPTPARAEEAPPWMHVGFAAWTECRGHGPEPMEVYPAGAFRVLAGGRVPPKTTPAGLVARRALLAEHIEAPPGFAMWSHDGLDAAVAALTAAHGAWGTAVAHGHHDATCDPTPVWLPAAPADRGPPTAGR